MEHLLKSLEKYINTNAIIDVRVNGTIVESISIKDDPYDDGAIKSAAIDDLLNQAKTDYKNVLMNCAFNKRLDAVKTIISEYGFKDSINVYLFRKLTYNEFIEYKELTNYMYEEDFKCPKKVIELALLLNKTSVDTDIKLLYLKNVYDMIDFDNTNIKDPMIFMNEFIKVRCNGNIKNLNCLDQLARIIKTFFMGREQLIYMDVTAHEMLIDIIIRDNSPDSNYTLIKESINYDHLAVFSKVINKIGIGLDNRKILEMLKLTASRSNKNCYIKLFKFYKKRTITNIIEQNDTQFDMLRNAILAGCLPIIQDIKSNMPSYFSSAYSGTNVRSFISTAIHYGHLEILEFLVNSLNEVHTGIVEYIIESVNESKYEKLINWANVRFSEKK